MKSSKKKTSRKAPAGRSSEDARRKKPSRTTRRVTPVMDIRWDAMIPALTLDPAAGFVVLSEISCLYVSPWVRTFLALDSITMPSASEVEEKLRSAFKRTVAWAPSEAVRIENVETTHGSIRHTDLFITPLADHRVRVIFVRDKTDFIQRERAVAEAYRDLENRKFEFEKRNQQIEQAHRELEEVKHSVLEANRLKSEFLSNMSHELRTPLNSILALSSILLARMDGELTEEQDKQIRIIEKSGKSLLALINDILDLSKIEAGRMDLIFTEYAVPEFLDMIRSTINPLLRESNLEFDVTIDPGIDVHSTDENKLKQALLNLLSNAIKFTPSGKVTLQVRNTKFNDVLEYAVIDTGIGIEQTHFESIFDPFRQIDGSATRKYGGTGLGLALTKKVIELLGGRIWVESEVNRGSKFCFILPAKRRGQSTQVLSEQEIDTMVAESRHPTSVVVPDEEAVALDPDRRKILVVDDDEESLYIMKKYLSDGAFQMINARDGMTAIQKARELQPDIITLDIMMPKKDGWEVLQELKRDASTRNIPVVVISMLDSRKLGYSLGAADYMVKPIVKETLVKHLTKLSEEHSLKKILIVDDDLSQAELVEEILESDDFISEVATNGEMAIQLLRRKNFDLVILDLLMPHIDGFEVLQSIQSNDLARNTPVLVLTGKVLTQDDQQKLSMGNCHIFQKSMFSREKLLENIHRVLEELPPKTNG